MGSSQKWNRDTRSVRRKPCMCWLYCPFSNPSKPVFCTEQSSVFVATLNTCTTQSTADLIQTRLLLHSSWPRGAPCPQLHPMVMRVLGQEDIQGWHLHRLVEIFPLPPMVKFGSDQCCSVIGVQIAKGQQQKHANQISLNCVNCGCVC